MNKITGGFTTEGKSGEDTLQEVSDAGAEIKTGFSFENANVDHDPFEGKNVRDSKGRDFGQSIAENKSK